MKKICNPIAKAMELGLFASNHQGDISAVAPFTNMV